MKKIAVITHKAERRHLDTLVGHGLWGDDRRAVLRSLMLEGLRSAHAKGFLRPAAPKPTKGADD